MVLAMRLSQQRNQVHGMRTSRDVRGRIRSTGGACHRLHAPALAFMFMLVQHITPGSTIGTGAYASTPSGAFVGNDNGGGKVRTHAAARGVRVHGDGGH